jgi:hypothetical protein
MNSGCNPRLGLVHHTSFLTPSGLDARVGRHMTPEDLETIRTIVADVVQSEDPFTLWSYLWVIIVAAAFGFISSYLGTYLQTKGQNLATKEDFKQILEQTRQTTEATEAIKADIAAESAHNNEIRQGQYTTATSLYSKLVGIMTNVNRRRYGYEIPPDFMNKNDIVPLTEVYEELTAKRFLIDDKIYECLKGQADLILERANVPSDQQAEYESKGVELEQLNRDFGALIRQKFGY